MKSRSFLAISLALNLVLVAVSGYLAFKPRQASVPIILSPTVGTDRESSVSPPQRAQTGAASTTPSFHWSVVESSDYKQYIANLRAIGCPEETIRDLIITEINKLYAPKFAALRPPPKPSSFPHAGDPLVLDRNQKVRALKQERREILRELLGGDFYDEFENVYGETDPQDWMLSFLSPDKRRAVKELTSKYDQMEQHLVWRSNGFWYSDDAIERNKLKQRFRTDLKTLLGVEELEQYDLRTSGVANQLRFKLKTFQPTEEEFLKIYRLQLQSRGDNREVAGMPAAARPGSAREPLGENLEMELRAALGEQRYADYNRSQEPGFSDIGRFAQRFDLPKETALQIYDMKKQAEEQQRRLLTDPQISEERRLIALQAMSKETERVLQGLIGPKLLGVYRLGGNTSWLYPEPKR